MCLDTGDSFATHSSGETPWVLHLKLTKGVTSSIRVLGFPASMPVGPAWSEGLGGECRHSGPKGSAGWTGRTQSHTVGDELREQLGQGAAVVGWALLFLVHSLSMTPPSPSNQHALIIPFQLLSACLYPEAPRTHS